MVSILVIKYVVFHFHLENWNQFGSIGTIGKTVRSYE